MKAYVFALALLLFSLSACDLLSPCGSDKTAFLKNHKALVDRAASLKTEDKEALAKLDKDMERMQNECYAQFEKDLSVEEKTEYLMQTGRYLYHRHGIKLAAMLLSTQDVLVKTFQAELKKLDLKATDILKKIEAELEKSGQ